MSWVTNMPARSPRSSRLARLSFILRIEIPASSNTLSASHNSAQLPEDRWQGLYISFYHLKAYKPPINSVIAGSIDGLKTSLSLSTLTFHSIAKYIIFFPLAKIFLHSSTLFQDMLTSRRTARHK
jgi:hypothetical protein